MNYDFDKVVPRRGTGCVKWDTPQAEGVLPMWVADMDFRTAPEVIRAVERRAAHGIYGYTEIPTAYYDATVGWFGRRHGWNIRPEWIVYTTGVIPALWATIKALAEPGERVIIQTPVYNSFFSSILNNDCEISDNALIYENGRYRIDFDDFERRAADPRAKVFLLCNPHNPVGRVWTRDELRRMGEICLRHGVFVISDEIHCELTYQGHDYTPYGALGAEFLQHSVACTSPSKAFNLAGLQTANIIVADEQVRRRIEHVLDLNEACTVTPFGVEALIAAYNEGGQWLDELRGYLYENYLFLREFFSAHLPQYPILPLEGTYLVWVDCRAAGIGSEQLTQQLLDEQLLMVNPGTMYGGEGFLRLNIACPRELLAEGLRRLKNKLG